MLSAEDVAEGIEREVMLAILQSLRAFCDWNRWRSLSSFHRSAMALASRMPAILQTAISSRAQQLMRIKCEHRKASILASAKSTASEGQLNPLNYYLTQSARLATAVRSCRERQKKKETVTSVWLSIPAVALVVGFLLPVKQSCRL